MWGEVYEPLVNDQWPHNHHFCDTPGVYFALCREIYPNLGCSVKISISQSHLSSFIKLLMNVSPNLEIIRSQEQPNLEPVKTFVS
jgi:hypothetical protein